MTILFRPSGHLDLATDPAALPSSADKGGNLQGQDMTRLQNLRQDRKGIAELRYGSSKINATAIDTTVYHVEEQAGDRYAFANMSIYQDETAIETGLTAAQWTSCKYNAWNTTTEAVFALNGTDRKRIEGANVYEWGHDAPSSAPTTAVGAGSGLTGDYSAKITYLRKEGSTVVFESSASAAGTTRTLADGSLNVTWTDPTDTQITHIRVYRTESGGSTYYLDQDVAYGVQACDTNTADSSLTSTEPPTDHDRPPLGSVVFGPAFDGSLFILYENKIYFCKTKQPEYWPTAYYVEAGSLQYPLIAGIIFNGQVYVLSQLDIYVLQGTSYNTFFPVPMAALCGTRAAAAIAGAVGYGIYHLGADGIYLFTGSLDTNITDDRFRPIFQGATVNGVPGINLDALDQCLMAIYRNRLFFAYPGGSNTTASDFLIGNLKTGQTQHYTYGNNFTALKVDEYNDRLLAADTSGYVWVLEDSSVTLDDTTAISWALETQEFTLQTRAHFPRWVKYDVDASGATTATGTVYLDGVSHQSHTLNQDRNTKRRLVKTGNGERMSVRVSGSGPIEIYALEAE